MTKDDRALKQVWQWKDEIYQQTKGMSVKEFVKFAHKRAVEFHKKYKIRLTKAEKTEA